MKLPYKVGMRMHISPGIMFPHLYQYFKNEVYEARIQSFQRGTAQILLVDETPITQTCGGRAVSLIFTVPIDDLQFEDKPSKKRQEK